MQQIETDPIHMYNCTRIGHGANEESGMKDWTIRIRCLNNPSEKKVKFLGRKTESKPSDTRTVRPLACYNNLINKQIK